MSKEPNPTVAAPDEAPESSLGGKRVAISRAPADAAPLAELLREAGASVWPVPLIRIDPPRDLGALAAAIVRLEQYDWVVVTSAHAVRALGGAQKESSRQWPHHVQWGAVGAATARALIEVGVHPTLVPEEATGESLAAALIAQASGGMSGCRVLFPRSSIAGRMLVDALRAAGAEVDEVETYVTRPDLDSARSLVAATRDHRIDAIVLTSPSNVDALFAAAGPGWSVLPGSVPLIAIGPTTATRLRDLGRPPAAVAVDPGPDGIVQAIHAALR